MILDLGYKVLKWQSSQGVKGFVGQNFGILDHLTTYILGKFAISQSFIFLIFASYECRIQYSLTAI